jgi:steroid delta-isomerase-like uncharacterized protein
VGDSRQGFAVCAQSVNMAAMDTTPADGLDEARLERSGATLRENVDALREWAVAWWIAWDAHDTEAVAALVHDEIVYEDPSMLGEQIRGKAQFHDFVAMVFRAFPDLRFEQSDWPMYVPLDGVGVAFPWRARGTFTGDMRPGPSPFQLAPTGKAIVVEGVDLYELRDGLLLRWAGIANGLEMLDQASGASFRRVLPLIVRGQRALAPLLRRIR